MYADPIGLRLRRPVDRRPLADHEQVEMQVVERFEEVGDRATRRQFHAQPRETIATAGCIVGQSRERLRQRTGSVMDASLRNGSEREPLDARATQSKGG